MSNGGYLSNHLLIAIPAMQDPNFSRSVTLICRHDADGAMGLLINRGSDFRLGEVLSQMDITPAVDGLAEQRVLSGGPVQPERGFVLHAPGERDWDSTYRISDQLAVTTSRDVLEAVAAGTGPDRVVVTLGYAGWGAGQLETELADNAWLTVAMDSGLLFDTALEQRWDAAARLIGVDLSLFTAYSGHA